MSLAPEGSRFLRSARTVSALTLLSRVLGLLRDSATAWLLGSSWVNDALNYAWTLPNAFRRLFGEGALSAAFVPVLSDTLQREGKERARQVANTVVCTMGALLLALAALLVVLVGLLPDGVLPTPAGTEAGVAAGASADRDATLLLYVRLLLPYLAGVCVVAQLMAVLNVLGEFVVPALAQVIVNLVWIAGVGAALLLAPGDLPRQGAIIAASVLLSAVLQFLWHLPRLAALGMPFAWTRPRFTPELRRVFALLGPMIVGMGAGQLAVLADNEIALRCLPEGGRTAVYYGMRVMQFPMGLVAVALATVVYPLLTKQVLAGERSAAAATAGVALRADLLLTLPAAAGLLVLARPIVGLLFEHGRYVDGGADRAAAALMGYALAIPSAGAMVLLTRACYALGELGLPVRVGLLMVVVNVALDLALVGPLAEFGLGLANAASSALGAGLLLAGLRRRLGAPLGIGRSRLFALLLVVAAMAALVLLVDRALAPLAPDGKAGDLLRVAAGIGLGLLIFLSLARRLCPREWEEVSVLWRRPAVPRGP